jgi:hypothetical protein
MTTTHWYQLPDHQTAHVFSNGVRIHGEEFEVACNAERTLVEVKQAVEGGGVLLARTIHEAMVLVTNLLRQKVAEVDMEHVAVLIRTPLTVLAADTPPRIVTDECGKCAGCQAGVECLERMWVVDADGKPMTLPGTVGYAAFAIVAIVGSPEPLTPPSDAEVVSVDAEPFWMTIPELDVERVRSLCSWKGREARYEIVDMLMPRRAS